MRLSLPWTDKASAAPLWAALLTICSAGLAAVATVVTVGRMSCAPEGIEFSDASAASTKVSLLQAVSLAERQLNGKAIQAGLQRRDFGWIYLVRVTADGKLFDAEIDADGGAVEAVSTASPHDVREGD